MVENTYEPEWRTCIDCGMKLYNYDVCVCQPTEPVMYPCIRCGEDVEDGRRCGCLEPVPHVEDEES
jgi:hypothetical protein